MPDLDVDRIDLPERLQPASDRPPISDHMGPHPYQESEFPEGKGHCDLCGGGPDAKVHNYVDPMERIAAALERIADRVELWSFFE